MADVLTRVLQLLSENSRAAVWALIGFWVAWKFLRELLDEQRRLLEAQREVLEMYVEINERRREVKRERLGEAEKDE